MTTTTAHAKDRRRRGAPPRGEQRHRARARRRKPRWYRRPGYLAVVVTAAVLITLAIVLPRGTGRSGEAAGGGPAIGAVAPNFDLVDAVSGEHVTRDSLAGRKTLLFFSEGVSCQACMVQVGSLQNNSALTKAGVRLVSVTTDSADTLAQAAQQYGIRTPLLADPTTTMSSAYGMLGHGGMGHPTADGHAFMLLDERGRIAWHQAYTTMFVDPSKLLEDMGIRT